MLALYNTPKGPGPIEIRAIPDPQPADHEALVEIRAFSLNRGELASYARNKEGWIPGQDVAGVVLRAACSGQWQGSAGRQPGGGVDGSVRLGATGRGACSSHGDPAG